MEALQQIKKEDVQAIVDALVGASSSFQSQSSPERPSSTHQLNNKDWLFVNLLPLAVDLITDAATLRKIKQEFIDNQVSKCQGLSRILYEWVNAAKNNATLMELHLHLSLNGLQQLTDKLQSLTMRSKIDPTQTGTNDNTNASPYRSNDANLEVMSTTPSSCSVTTDHNMHTRQRAFSNAVIMEEILKKLPVKDIMEMRLANHRMWSETLSFWRRKIWMKINITSTDYPEVSNKVLLFNDKVITMQSFMELLQHEGQIHVEGGIPENSFNYHLLEHSFYRYRLQYNGSSYPLREENIDEIQFWNTFGSKVIMLNLALVACPKIGNTDQAYLQQVVQLLLENCVNLEELQIEEFNSGPDDNITKNWTRKENRFKSGKVAEKLHTLVSNTLSSDIVLLFKILPNLKNLKVRHECQLHGLTDPTTNGKQIKLETLKMYDHYDAYRPDVNFIPLRNYIQHHPGTLKHIEIKGIDLLSLRREPYELYAGLAQCINLETLILDIKCPSASIEFREKNWFWDLSVIKFPNLKNFQLETFVYIDFAVVNQRPKRPVLKFDFGSIKGMPKLEKLEVYDHERFLRHHKYSQNPVSEEWFFQNEDGLQRNRYKPEGVSLNYNFSEVDSIASENLKRLSFDGSHFNAENLRIIDSWFPNLTHLNVFIDRDNLLPVFKDSFLKLKTLLIHSKDPLYKEELKSLKRLRQNLQIIQNVERLGRIEILLGWNDDFFFRFVNE